MSERSERTIVTVLKADGCTIPEPTTEHVHRVMVHQ
jgi:hypothetical protein